MAKSKVKIEWIDKGFKEILNSKELESVCISAAEAIAKKANGLAAPYNDSKEEAEFISLKWHSNMKGGRVAAIAATHNYQAKEVQAENHILEKATQSTRV